MKKSAGKTAAKARQSSDKEKKISVLKDVAPRYDLRLYVAGQSPRSLAAFDNLKKICEEYLAGMYKIKIVDLLKNPKLAQGDQIVAIPTLVRKLPAPLKKIIGDLSNKERVVVGLDIRPI